MEPTIDLTILQPADGGHGDPLANLLLLLAFVWLVGVPWLRFCWWLGQRPLAVRTPWTTRPAAALAG